MKDVFNLMIFSYQPHIFVHQETTSKILINHWTNGPFLLVEFQPPKTSKSTGTDIQSLCLQLLGYSNASQKHYNPSEYKSNENETYTLRCNQSYMRDYNSNVYVNVSYTPLRESILFSVNLIQPSRRSIIGKIMPRQNSSYKSELAIEFVLER